MTPIRILFSGMLIAAATGLVSCREPAPTAPFIPAPRMQASWAGSGGLLYCKPLPPDSVTQSIGPSGGQIRVSKHVLSILPGTLTQTVAITIVAPSDTLNRLQFQPEGLTFNKPVALTMSYANCTLDKSLGIRIAYLDNKGNVISYVPSQDDPGFKKVTGWLAHFSQYAVSW